MLTEYIKDTSGQSVILNPDHEDELRLYTSGQVDDQPGQLFHKVYQGEKGQHTLGTPHQETEVGLGQPKVPHTIHLKASDATKDLKFSCQS